MQNPTERWLKRPTFIDVDTHFVPVSALDDLSRTYPDTFALDRKGQEGVFRFFAQNRLLVLNRISQLSSTRGGGRSSGQVSLETKYADLLKESPDAVQVVGFAQGICGTRWAPVVGADVARALNDGVVAEMESFEHRERFIRVAAIYLPWVDQAVKEVERAVRDGFAGVYVGPIMPPYDDLLTGSP